MQIVSVTALLGFISAAAGAAVAIEGAEARAPAGPFACKWTGYGNLGFRDSYGSLTSIPGFCNKMPSSKWTQLLYSAKPEKGDKVCLFTSSFCGGHKQVIDDKGYADMRELPAFYSWNCC